MSGSGKSRKEATGIIHEEGTTVENIRRRIVEVETKEAGRSWGMIERLARDRPVWVNFVAALETAMFVQTTKRVSLFLHALDTMQMTPQRRLTS